MKKNSLFQQFVTEKEDQDQYQDGYLKIGPFLFNQSPSPVIKLSLKHLYITYNPRTEVLRLQNGRLKELIPQEALESAIKYQIQNLNEFSISNNKLYNISFLSKCDFPNLTILNLSRNYLGNMTEMFKSLSFPNLQQLYLSNNHLVNLRGIKRWRLPFLTKLTLDLNLILFIGQLYLADFPSLCQLDLYSNNIVNMRSLYKTNFPKLENLNLYENATDYDNSINFLILSTKYKFLNVGSLT